MLSAFFAGFLFRQKKNIKDLLLSFWKAIPKKDKRRRSFIFFFWRNRKPAKNAESIGSKTISKQNSILNFQSGKKIERDFNIKNINLEIPREDLYKRINHRVDEMMHAGLLKEAESL